MELSEYRISNFTTQGGVTLDIALAYARHGVLNARKDNCILVLTSYAATHEDAADLFANSESLDLSEYCVIVVNMLANSASSSPSNTPAPFDGPRFPLMTVHDNVRCQHQLMADGLGIDRLRLVMGYSMGALQTFEWGAQHADMVDAILPICGAARVSRHNWLFLEGAKRALVVTASRLRPVWRRSQRCMPDGCFHRASSATHSTSRWVLATLTMSLRS
jgi:homoserine O-acetyltransferase